MDAIRPTTAEAGTQPLANSSTASAAAPMHRQ
jgi:hypothetical protein